MQIERFEDIEAWQQARNRAPDNPDSYVSGRTLFTKKIRNYPAEPQPGND